jgi:hypothetical protein
MTVAAIPNLRAERLLVLAGRAFAVASVALGAVPCFIVFYEFDNGDKIFNYPIWGRIALCLWQIVPLPVVWWIGRSVARAAAALAVLVAGMALALAFEVRVYWAVFPLRVGSDLAVVAVPMLQLLFLTVIVLFAWLTGRWISWRSTHPPSAASWTRGTGTMVEINKRVAHRRCDA